MKTFKKLLFLLTPHERKRAGLLLIMIVIMAFLDMIGVASILPFMAVLTNPDLIETNNILNIIFQASSIFGVENDQQFLFILGFFVFVFLITSLIFKALTNSVQVRLAQRFEYNIGKRLIEGYLHQSYSWFLNRHTADLGKTILSESGQVVANGISPLMELISKLIVTITLISLLVIVDPKLTLIIGLSLGGAYGFIFYFIRSSLDRLGKERLKNNQLRFTAISEAFGATKEIKVGGLEQIFIKFFAKASKDFSRTQASSQILALLPRYILEAFAFGGVLLMILYVIAQKGSFNNALPILSLYIFTGYRLLPALNKFMLLLLNLLLLALHLIV